MTPIDPSPRNPPPAGGTAFYIWSPAEAAWAVHLHLAVVDRLRAAIRESAAGARGREAVCGLLLGRTLPHSHGIVIEDNLALSCSDPISPSTYFLNAGQTALREKMSKWSRGEGKRLWTVGYYQHQADGHLTAHDSDIVLLKSEFGGPGNVMLLSALAAGNPIAGFFVREGEEIQRHTPLPFPLSRMELRQAAAAAAPPPPAEADFVPTEAPAPGTRRWTQHDAIRWISLGIVAFTLAVIGISQYPKSATMRSSNRNAAEPPGSELQLTVEGTPERVVLKWNRNAPAIAQGIEGALSITEGESTQILMLKPADLATGSLVYFSKSADVAFQLEVTTANRRKVSQRVHLLAGQRR